MTELNIINRITAAAKLQFDGFYSATHINYSTSPCFVDIDARDLAVDARKNSISKERHIDVFENLEIFRGTERGIKKKERNELWKYYWLEYVHAFFEMSEILEKSVTTAYIGRHSIELGFKYIFLIKGKDFPKTHNLSTLANELRTQFNMDEYEWDDIVNACEIYSKYLEGDNAEYFRYPEYIKDEFFAGNNLDIKWIIYNFAIIILKLMSYVGLEEEIEKIKRL